MPDGAVMAIDSQWGDGKTWFGKRWCASLGDKGFKTAYVDCFQRDHLDDPFLMIAAEFIELAKSGEPELQRKLLETGKKVGIALLPAMTKFAVNTLGHWAIGNAGLSEDLAKASEALDASAAAGLEKLVATHLAEYQASLKTLEAFKESLVQLSAESEKPIVIFLDELDRCRPDFAVRTIERVKHFFDVPKVVFVLLVNRRQLCAAVEGLYGSKVDANAYLAKFIPISLNLPKRTSIEQVGRDDNARHCRGQLIRLGFSETTAVTDFASIIGMFASLLGLSLRDMERAAILYSYAQPLNRASSVLPWPVALKLHNPDLYKRICANDAEAHREARQLGGTLMAKAPSLAWVLGLFDAIHLAGESNFEGSLPTEASQTLRSIVDFRSPKSFIEWLFGRIDLTVAD